MRTTLPVLLALGVGGCMVGPDYERPDLETPAQLRYEDSAEGEMLTAQWWTAYDDPELTALIETATEANPDIGAALARVDRAAASVGVARSELFPQVDFFTEAMRQRSSGNQTRPYGDASTRNNFASALGLAWELDVWGRVRRLSASAMAEAQAQADAYGYAIVLVQTLVAQQYFEIRTLDQRIEFLEKTVAGRKRSLDLVEVRRNSGLADDLEFYQASTEWSIARSELEGFRRRRALAQNALAILMGTYPSDFALAPDPGWVPYLPPAPPAVASTLLERRPDLAQAESVVRAASERIGARVAEYFPRIQITGDVGFAAADAGNWFTRSSLFGSLGPSVSMPVFNAGRISSQVDEARAEYRELLELYRGQVLTAFKEVEDALAALRTLHIQIEAQQDAASAARSAAEVAQQRYETGLVNYLEVVDTERTALNNALLLAELENSLYARQLDLIRALGGGWSPASLSSLQGEDAMLDALSNSAPTPPSSSELDQG
ncbi:efflux transporter outer membrane subunit [Ruficoccus amylovorans]|uniref:Efflux transporter outer membrane subunit n=1 Tax=Ruficoccus amylovorans TaxID=1804625 RepID=A0A842HFJ2_9BACT|nr:efflux transporter outer membrane subunit [Ruficoccus amylovorans]MBC2595182.1 efflux transporter outer membrane subunit [Ruficoccus amylovorans]